MRFPLDYKNKADGESVANRRTDILQSQPHASSEKIVAALQKIADDIDSGNDDVKKSRLPS